MSSVGKSSPGSTTEPVRRRTLARRRTRTAYAFLLPSGLILALFVLYPMVAALRTSFTNASLFGSSSWIGLENYRALFADSRFTNALKNTIIYAFFTTVISVALALVVAVALDRRLRGRSFFRAAFFFPFVASLGISSIAWSFLLDPQVGVVSNWLSAVGLSIGNGVRDPHWALPAVILVGIWRNVGFFMVMYLAGLQSIPRELKEAALVDGATSWQKFRLLTWPLLSNTTMFVLMVAAIFSFQAFDQIYVMTNGGPYFKSETLVMLIYNTGFQDYRLGYASAISWILVAIVLCLSLVQMAYFSRRSVRY